MTTQNSRNAHGITKRASMFLITALCLTIFPKPLSAQINRARSGRTGGGSLNGQWMGQSDGWPPILLPPKNCGPRWLGGCWNVHAPRHSNWEVVKSPYFWGPTAADALVTSLDGAVTSYGLSHSGCYEANHDLGPHPSDGRLAGINALIFGVTTGFRFLALKAIPKDSHSRGAWIPRAFSIGTAARSAQVHIRGAMSWFNSGCL